MHLTTSRQAYIDWLRAAAVYGIFGYTAARPFMGDSTWMVKNTDTSLLLTKMAQWLNTWCLPLLFFVSGAATWHMTISRDHSKRILLWLRRLFIPLTAGILLVLPPQIYIERLNSGYQGRFTDFLPSFFEGRPYPGGNTSWHHLRVIACLAIYEAMLAPLLSRAASFQARNVIRRLAWFYRGYRIYLLAIPGIIWYCCAPSAFPDNAGRLLHTADFICWGIFLVTGILFAMQPILADSLVRNRRASLAGLLTCILTGIIIRTMAIHHTPLLSLLTVLHVWFLLFTLTGYAKKYLDSYQGISGYTTIFMSPFFILQQTVTVLAAWFIVRLPAGPELKFLLIASSSWMASALIIHLLIRPFILTRLLFGVKPKTPPVVTGKVIKVQLPSADFFY
ncbi:hypothetical protein [Chitinophaga solisilvae]|uniref:hypothetical protein n=1 Tax=Chitinophaga solisilvae TaxID=1233460 RepID=UPI00136DD1B2|nr:hypothetical protein [Chitinophaga solisilvae]